MEPDEAIGQNVRQLRQGLGLSHAQLATELSDYGLPGIYPQTIVKIEQGKRALKLREGLLLAKVFGVDAADLVELDDLGNDVRELNRLLRSAHDALTTLAVSSKAFRRAYLELVAFARLTPAPSEAAVETVATNLAGWTEILESASKPLEDLPEIKFCTPEAE